MPETERQKASKEAHINSVAIRCFRDTADADYIAARMAYRARLFSQFFWSAEQAIEKYLKCILMLNRQKVKFFGHDIAEGLKQLNSLLPFKIEFTQPEITVFDQIVRQDADRYFNLSWHVHDVEVLKLDLLVWRLRQYCTPLDVERIGIKPSRAALLRNIARLEARLSDPDTPSKKGHLMHGLLEKILKDRKHPARESLVWQNARFTTAVRKTIKTTRQFHASNAPLWLTPELLDDVKPYMHVPGPYAEAYRKMAISRKTHAARR